MGPDRSRRCASLHRVRRALAPRVIRRARSRRAVNRDRLAASSSRSLSTVGIVGWTVADHLVAMLGLYGATLAFSFVAGMFPLLSIEVILVGRAVWGGT